MKHLRINDIDLKYGCDHYYLCTGMNTKIFKRCDLGRGPAAILGPVNGQHVVSEHFAECELVDWRLGLHLCQAGLSHLQSGTVQL